MRAICPTLDKGHGMFVIEDRPVGVHTGIVKYENGRNP